MTRRASLGTIFFTVFLDLLGFGLVVPYLPGVARAHGGSDFVATLLGAGYSLMQLLFVPYWGQLSDRRGGRPILLVSIAASIGGMLLLGSAGSLWVLFAARIWSGIATSNIAVAQAYIADITRPEERARGMGMIGAGIGLGFVFGPVIGGLLESVNQDLHLLPRPGALPAYAAAALGALNLLLAVFFLPESLPPEARGKADPRAGRFGSPFDRERYRRALGLPGARLALLLNFVLVLSFAGMEQTFRLFTEDELGMDVRQTSYVLGVVGVILILVQGALIRPLSRLIRETRLITLGVALEAVGFALLALSAGRGSTALVYVAMGTIALGSGLTNPSLSAFVSRRCDLQSQGAVLGVLQSAGAFARVCGPAGGGALYQGAGHAAPYVAAALGMSLAGALSLRLGRPLAGAPEAPAPAARG
ncbi:MAG: MFS transporter [Byssovorax sp.]